MIFLLLNLFSQRYLVVLCACRARSLLKRNMDRNLTAGGGGERFEGQGGKQKGRGGEGDAAKWRLLPAAEVK
jgi:hypothetical protein